MRPKTGKIKVTAIVEKVYDIELYKEGQVEICKEDLQDQCVGAVVDPASFKVYRKW